MGLSAPLVSADAHKRISTEIAARRDDLISLTQALIRIPTLNPPGAHYRDICDFLAARLTASGFESHLVRAKGALGDSDEYPRWNLVARHISDHPGDCVHFNSHTDVVEVGAGWTRDPFGGQIEGDLIYGRGACDMKGGLAASIIAAEAFIAACPDYVGAIEISATADEESGGFGGVAYLAEQGWFAPDRVQHVIIPEPLNKDRICLGHRGVWWAELETKGRIAHGSMPFLGDCAIRHMGAVIADIEDNLVPLLASRSTAMPVVPPQARQSTININSIHGGQEELGADYTGYPAAVVPDSCRIIIDRRYLIEEDPGDVKAEIAAVMDRVAKARPGFRYEIKDMFEVAPIMTDKNAPIVQTVAAAIEQVMKSTAEYVISPGTYDQKHIDRIGKLQNCIAYGPGQLELAHQPDEHISITDMVESAEVMAISLASLLTPKTPDPGQI